MELPIYSITGADSQALKKYFPNLYYKWKLGALAKPDELKWAMERDRIKKERYPVKDRFYKKNQKKNLSFYFKALISQGAVQLDYDYLPATVFVAALEKIFADKSVKRSNDEDFILPVIASGHVKDMHNTDNIRKIFELIETRLRGRVKYLTLSEAVDIWLKQENKQ